jgi:hypothetical protein
MRQRMKRILFLPERPMASRRLSGRTIDPSSP